MKIFLISMSTLVALSSCSFSGSQNEGEKRSPSEAYGWPYPLNSKFERKLENEEELVQRIRDGILYVQQMHAKEQPDNRLLRGTHSKGVCVKARLDINDIGRNGEVPAPIAGRLQKGFFSSAGSYEGIVRFANAKGSILSDHSPDVRAVSLMIGAPGANPQNRLDFSMNDSPTFPIANAEVFADIMTFAQYGKALAFLKIGSPRRIRAVLRAREIGDQQERAPFAAYQKNRYWSNVPFQLGPDEAVKYSLEPCKNNQAQNLGSGENALRDELLRHVSSDAEMSCFDFRVQLLDDKMKTADGQERSIVDWVEDASTEWTSPFYTVGKLTLVKGSALNPAECERLSVSVTKFTNETHRGMGSINRARGVAETASAHARGVVEL